MTTLRGLLFAHPDFDTALSWSIPGAPGRPTVGLICSAQGRLEPVTGTALLRQSLLVLLSTYPGERVMRPDYGCELLGLTFSPNDDTTAGLAIHYVRQAVARFEPRVRVLRVDARRSDLDPHRLEVVLEYQPRIGGNTDSLSVGLQLDDAGN